MANRREIYNSLWNAYIVAFPNKAKDLLQREYNLDWTQMKLKSENDSDFENIVLNRIRSLQQKAAIRKSENILLFCTKTHGETSATSASSTSKTVPTTVINLNVIIDASQKESDKECSVADDKTLTKTTSTLMPTPSQDRSKERINELQGKISNLVGVQNIGFGNRETEREIIKLTKEVVEEKKSLSKKMSDAIRKRKSRKQLSSQIKDLVKKQPELKKKLKFRNGVIG